MNDNRPPPADAAEQLKNLQDTVSDLLLAIALCPIPTSVWETHLKDAVSRTYEQMPSDCHTVKGYNVYRSDGTLFGFVASRDDGWAFYQNGTGHPEKSGRPTAAHVIPLRPAEYWLERTDG